ncbi:MAG TPA: SUMF1/EgtB/PvdO family nonheme iron enzyme, partial [Dinghuibacter sp.]|uniref:formylglycine-generating enzyme family protein n=1 Tax=Dinghuibacter sp. TaxID=2024697 RepID=UPI002D01077C
RYKDSVVLEFTIEGRGYGAVLATSGEVPAVGAAPRSLGSFSSTWTPLPQTIVRTGTTPRVVQPPPGMVRIPAAKRYAFVSEGVMLEGGDLPAANGIQHPWQTQPAKSLTHTMDIPSFYIDVYPVTNAQFQRFMEATHYHPRDSHNFLKDWRGGHYPDGWADKPVTWVSIEDARAYATWAHKRLPHEWEWTYAAQGTDGRAYPWGNDRDSTKVPATDRGRRISPPYAVTAFPGGASPFGVRDLVGNVWQWTDEYRDAHTRAAVLKGGSRYLPKGDYYKGQSPTGWYFPPVTDVLHYGRYLLLSPGEDRSATVGFRCVKDR